MLSININEKVVPLTSIPLEEVKESSFFSDLVEKLCLLVPYKPYDIKFSQNSSDVYKFIINDNVFLLFGNDIHGHYFMDKEKKHIFYSARKGQGLHSCNSNIDKFIVFNNFFISMLMKRIEEFDASPDTQPIHVANSMRKVLYNLDIDFMSEDSFWSKRILAFSEDFFALDEEYANKIKKYREMGIYC